MRKVIITAVSFAVLLGTAAIPWTALSQEAVPAVTKEWLSFPASAFNEFRDGYDYRRSSTLTLDTSGSAFFYAPIYLPQGSVIRKIILMCWDDNAIGNIQLHIKRRDLDGPWEYLATAVSTYKSDTWRVFSKRLTSKRYVNNMKFSYYLRLDLNSGWEDGYRFFRAVVVYTPPTP